MFLRNISLRIFILIPVAPTHPMGQAAQIFGKQALESRSAYGSFASREIEMNNLGNSVAKQRSKKILATGTFERINDSERPNDNRTEVFIQFSLGAVGSTAQISEWIGKKSTLSCERLNADKTTTTILDEHSLKKERELINKVHKHFKELDTTKILWWSYESTSTVFRKFIIYEDHTIKHANVE